VALPCRYGVLGVANRIGTLSDLTDSFTHSLTLSLSDLDQAPSIGDINGDGALDVVIATGKGHIWALYGLARAS
jgi:hypothetical protein